MINLNPRCRTTVFPNPQKCGQTKILFFQDVLILDATNCLIFLSLTHGCLFQGAILPSQFTMKKQTSKTKDEEQIDKAGFLAIYTYFASGINITGLAITMIHHHVILVFTYILPIHKMTCSVGPQRSITPYPEPLECSGIQVLWI